MTRSLYILFSLCLFIAAPVLSATAENSSPKPPYSIGQLRAWHKSMEPWPWLGQPEQGVNLKEGGKPALLLAVSGYARGGTYLLFAERDGKWIQVSDEIEQAHHPIRILPGTHDGWHDFETFVPAWGSGGAEVWVSTYGWNGEKYILKGRKDGKWCETEPFRSDVDLCPPR